VNKLTHMYIEGVLNHGDQQYREAERASILEQGEVVKTASVRDSKGNIRRRRFFFSSGWIGDLLNFRMGVKSLPDIGDEVEDVLVLDAVTAEHKRACRAK